MSGHRTSVLAVLVLALTSELGAQSPEPRQGDRVRIVVGDPQVVISGTLQGLRQDTLVLEVEGRPQLFPMSGIHGAEVSRRIGSQWLVGGLAGGVLGGLAGTALREIACQSLDFGGPCTPGAAASAGVGAGLGALLGVAIGGVIPKYGAFETLQPPRFGVAISPARKVLTVSVSIGR